MATETPKRRQCYKCGSPNQYITSFSLAAKEVVNDNLMMPVLPSQRGRVHHLTADAAQEASEVVLGACTINGKAALVLFDSGASHSFISKKFAAQHRLPVVPLEHLLMVQTPATNMRTTTACPNLIISINQVDFPTKLNTLSTPGLDAILGMDWLVKHSTHIDCANRAVTHTNPEGISTTYTPNRMAKMHTKVFTVQTTEIDQVQVVREYPEVFSDDLPTRPQAKLFSIQTPELGQVYVG
ncbi:hypothetical protein ACQ4PT_071356 [Festuca glaucescens]